MDLLPSAPLPSLSFFLAQLRLDFVVVIVVQSSSTIAPGHKGSKGSNPDFHGKSSPKKSNKMSVDQPKPESNEDIIEKLTENVKEWKEETLDIPGNRQDLFKRSVSESPETAKASVKVSFCYRIKIANFS